MAATQALAIHDDPLARAVVPGVPSSTSLSALSTSPATSTGSSDDQDDADLGHRAEALPDIAERDVAFALAAAAAGDADPITSILVAQQAHAEALSEDLAYWQRKAAAATADAARLHAHVAHLQHAEYKLAAHVQALARDRDALTAAVREAAATAMPVVGANGVEVNGAAAPVVTAKDAAQSNVAPAAAAAAANATTATAASAVPTATTKSVAAQPPVVMVSVDRADVADIARALHAVAQSAANDDDDPRTNTLAPPPTPLVVTDADKADPTTVVRAAVAALRHLDHRRRQLRADNADLAAALEEAAARVDDGEARLHRAAEDVAQLEDLNKALMEENEAFQRLLSERTMAGELSFVKPPTAAAHVSPVLAPAVAASAAAMDQLSLAEEIHVVKEAEKDEDEVARLQAENRALQLYIEKVLARLMDHPDLAALLAQDYAAAGAPAGAAPGARTPAPSTAASSAAAASLARKSRGSGNKRFSWMLPARSSISIPGTKSSSSRHHRHAEREAAIGEKPPTPAAAPAAAATAANGADPRASVTALPLLADDMPAAVAAALAERGTGKTQPQKAESENVDLSVSVDVLSPIPPPVAPAAVEELPPSVAQGAPKKSLAARARAGGRALSWIR
ncbi:hypothetical protein GGF31_004051 [Allomyces arbusculus]|nr:hypothetical protein GGF31_004051 [Allomyces arbusculus]